MHEVVDVIQTNATWSMVPIRLIKGIAVVLAVMCAIVAFLMGSLTFKPLQTGDILGLFLRLIAIAIFIERAVEVLLTPWRGPGALRIAARVKQAKAKLEKEEAGSAAEMSNVEDELRQYKGETRQMAFLIALTLGMAISAVGLRGLEYFVNLNNLSDYPKQVHVFHAVDALITGTLLAGKAEGLHKMALGITKPLGQSNKEG